MTTPTTRRDYDGTGTNVGRWPDARPDRLHTPPDEFFRRNHAPIPTIDAATWRLTVDGLVRQPLALSLDDLRRFPVHEVDATLVCAGLRRAELLDVAPLPGELPWGPDAASSGRWRGVRITDVLAAAGVREEARHVEFTGLDAVLRHGHVFGFGGSIDVARALEGDVLLATHLGGAPLAPAHGFPLRAVVPGWIGARSVKWLGRVTLRERESENYFQRRAYRVATVPGPAGGTDVSEGWALSTVALNAVIAEPRPDAVVTAGETSVRGWAIGGAGRPVTRVEVSSDGGATWDVAAFTTPAIAGAWRFWEATVALPPGRHALVARAFDGTDTMPAHPADAWNVKGYANNAWARAAVTARDSSGA